MKHILITLTLIITHIALYAQAIYKYDTASDFSEGLATVSINDKYGFINQSGEVVVPLEYDYAGDFSEGLAHVRKDKKRGFIDKTGKVVIPLEYRDAGSFSEGLAMVEGNDWKYGFIDKKGKVVIPFEYEFIFDDFHEGLVQAEKYDDDKVGVINKKGQVVVPFEYDDIGDFENGYAYIEKNDKVGIVNSKGKIVLPIAYEDVYPEMFKGKTIFVATDKQQGTLTVLDEKGTQMLHFTSYSSGYFFQEDLGLLSFADEQGNYGTVNMEGDIIIPFRYQRIICITIEEGLIRIKEDDKWGLYKLSGTTLQTIVEPKYDEMNFFSEGLAAVRSGNKWGYIDSHGKEVIPLKFDGSGYRTSKGVFYGGNFKEGFAPVYRLGKYGYVNKQGQLLPLKD